ncbi:dipeptide ABC transporter ATP-binding protein [Rhodococcoides kyotonense]|uniref:Peptide/nickel transport system ATP-binding protein n=1 Tax=Rhodococcoides kyotonense TaxID=398843 RepID=A0A239GAM1_9NOCA|nr:ABC transporter ATP-binding protein [Rhodococcus kyotonensis]SNS66121.1 peptide/nickel transport system ATP-binding protein [Rhodococcus kyotonensis]
MSDPILELDSLGIGYRTATADVDAVRSVSLTVGPGEVVALVGESGSGKSTTAHSVIGLLPGNGAVTSGRIVFDGRDITRLKAKKLREIRGAEIGFVPQDPGIALNPVKKIGVQVAEALWVHGLAGRREAKERAIEILARAGLSHPEARAQQYPHELSGGMKQRVLIGIALACRPKLVIADEPTSALDVTVQRRILDHLQELTASSGTAVLLITHDLGVAADRADRTVVMRHGEVVEQGPTRQILGNPQVAYTQKLLQAAPSLSGVPLVDSKAVPSTPLLSLTAVRKEFELPGTREPFVAVDDVSFEIARGRTFSLIGESGSGKSTVARSVLRLEQITKGRIDFDGVDVASLRGEDLRQVRKRIQLVYQNPFSSLDPRFSVADVVSEPLRAFGVGDKTSRRRRAGELLDQVALPTSALDRKAAELSGGQRQRVAIARALALDPELVVLDEPVSALDVSVQDQILRLLVELQERLGVAYLFISHDFAVVRQISHEVGVLRAGKLVEIGSTERVFSAPEQEYTRALIDAVPGQAVSLTATRGEVHYAS